MPINTITANQKLSDALDKALVQRSVTGMFADNVLRAKFVGAKTVLIPEVNMQGLGDYDRDTGFVRGAVSVTNVPFTLQQDRGRSFQIDDQDADESGIADLIGKTMGEFVRTKVIPEMDAYVLSKLAGLAVTESHTVTGTPATAAYKMLIEAIGKVQNAVGYDEELVAFVDSTFLSAIQNTPEITRQLVVSDFKRGGLDTKVKTLNGVAILPVSDARMKTAYTFNDGTTEGQTEGGFTPTGTAKSIGLLVLPKKACSLVKKTEKTRIFKPGENINADAWKGDYRVYYDAFVKESYKPGIYAYVY